MRTQTAAPKIVCPECGTRVSIGDKKCGHCGCKLEKKPQ